MSYRNKVLWAFIKERGWTIKDFAKAAGITFAAAQTYFSLTHLPKSKETIDKIVRITGKSAHDIFPQWAFDEDLKKMERDANRLISDEYDPGKCWGQRYSIEHPRNIDIDMPMLRDTIRGLFATLTDREADCLSMQFGLFGNGEHTDSEIAEEYGLSYERVRGISAKAMRRMRHPTRRSKLIHFLPGYMTSS